MNESQKPPRLVVTWMVLVPLLLVITFVFNFGTLLAVFVAALVSPMVHSVVSVFYKHRHGFPIESSDSPSFEPPK